jgi:uncharacterized protein (TIGR04255 family)
MQVPRRYNKPPITEAVIDLRVNLPEGFTVDKLNAIHSSLSENFPTIEPFYKGVGAISYQPGEAFKVDTSEQQIGYWFRSEDNLQTFQASLEGFSFNRLAPYESWEEFSSNAKKLWKIYKEICSPTHVTRLAVRYINQINIPVHELTELKDYLKTVPEVSPELPQNALQTFFMQLHIPQSDLDCMLIINEAIAPPVNPEFVSVILDLDLFRQQMWNSDDEEIWRFLEKLRDRKNEVFEASITDKTRELID